MPIPESLKGRYAYHFTLLDNLESIMDNGLLSTNLKNSKEIDHINIAEQGIQDRRSRMQIPCTAGRNVHDFVPFYFSKKTPMQLAIINKKNIDQQFIIYFAVPIELIERRVDVLFSDASANTDIPPNFFSQPEQLNQLNWDAVDEQKWGCPNDQFRHQKMAELLIPDEFNVCDASHIIVWNDYIKEKVEEKFSAKGFVCPPIKKDRDHYYIDFYDTNKMPIVTGPYVLNLLVSDTIKKVCKYEHGATKYPDIRAALDAISYDFSAIKELGDISGLYARYGYHNEGVDIHSRQVAENVIKLEEYNNLNQKNRDILHFAAYLHDIGKGPKSRWNNMMTKADNDHARKSLPMLKRILTEDIAKLDDESVRKIVMLVVYDDLIGDIMGNGRNEQQFFDVVTCEDDIHMLIAIAKADMMAVNPPWVFLHEGNIEILRVKAIDFLGNK